MWFLPASSISTIVKEKIIHCDHGRILNVFSRSMNIINENQELIGLTEPEAMNHPINILVPKINVFLPQCDIGMKVFFLKNSLRLDHFLEISLEHASFFDPSFKLHNPLLPFSSIQNNLEYVSRFTPYGRGGVGDLIPYYKLVAEGLFPQVRLGYWSMLLGPQLAGFCKALMNIDIEEGEKFFKKIIGTGIGLTPTGDDVLIGLFGSLSVLIHENKIMYKRHKLFPAESWINGTTPFAKVLLLYSLQRKLGEVVGNFLKGILTNSESIEDSLMKLLSIGASSGEDTLLGILIGVNIGLKILSEY